MLRHWLPRAFRGQVIRQATSSRKMHRDSHVEPLCRTISQNYSACDVSDALVKLKVPQAGFLPDIAPIPNNGSNRHFVAPISTVLFVSKSHGPGSATSISIPSESNIPHDKHWTDMPSPGTIALLQQPTGQVCAVLGDILASRLKFRGIMGVVADGRVRDISSLNALCKDGDFSVWSRGMSTVGTSLEAKPWAVDVTIRVGDIEVNPGDILCADEGDRGCVVIPQDKAQDVVNMMPALKEADEKCVTDVMAGIDVTEAFRRYRG